MCGYWSLFYLYNKSRNKVEKNKKWKILNIKRKRKIDNDIS